MTAIGKYFQLEEFTTSETAARSGRQIIVPDELMANGVRLVTTCLDPLREALGLPLHITSGYRPLWLNKLIGGAPGSAHQYFRAADTICPGMTNLELARRASMSGIPFDQIILEFPPGGWVHIATAEDGAEPRGQMLTALHLNGSTTYQNGFLPAGE